MKSEKFLTSCNQVTPLHVLIWKPEQPKAVLQLLHGMYEYIDRYDEFARFLNDQNIAVVGHDHLGHGQSIRPRETRGHFGDHSGVDFLFGDIAQVRDLIAREFQSLPVFLLGHSMGSFFARVLRAEQPDLYQGFVIMGTADESAFMVHFGKFLSGGIAKSKGLQHPSQLLHAMSFKAKNRKIKHKQTSVDWLNRNHSENVAYLNDPATNFIFSARAFHDMFSVMERMDQSNHPLSVPTLFLSGKEDAVGNFGKGPRAVASRLKAKGDNVEVILYPGARHEILKELNKEEVFLDVLGFIDGLPELFE